LCFRESPPTGATPSSAHKPISGAAWVGQSSLVANWQKQSLSVFTTLLQIPISMILKKNLNIAPAALF